MVYNLTNILAKSKIDNPVKYSKVIHKKRTYKLEKSINILLSDNYTKLQIDKGFTWDLASVPQFFHNIIRPNGDDDIAYLIHDYLYIYNIIDRKFADKEMFKWAKVMKGTTKWSWRNWDIKTRYYVVRLFGKIVWDK